MNIRERCPCGSEFWLTDVKVSRFYDEQKAKEWLSIWRERHRHHQTHALQRDTLKVINR